MKEEYIDNVSIEEFLRVIEHELLKFGSYKNIQSTLSKYMVGYLPEQEQLEKVAVILAAEMRAAIGKMAVEFSGDANESRAKFLKRARRLNSDFENDLMSEVMTSDKKEVDIELVGKTSGGKAVKRVTKKKKEV
mgnify:FL=1